MDSVTAVLSSEASLSTEAASDALAAVCALNGLGSVAALDLLLETRSVYLTHQLEEAAAAGASGGSINAAAHRLNAEHKLVQLAQGIQTTIHQVGELFLPQQHKVGHASASGPTTPQGGGAGAVVSGCLLQAAMEEEASDASELLFSGGRGMLSSGGAAPPSTSASNAPEVEAWQRESRRLHDGLVALTSGQVEKACTAWLRGAVAASFSSASAASILEASCTTATKLMEIEHAVHSAIASWQPPASAAPSVVIGGGIGVGPVQGSRVLSSTSMRVQLPGSFSLRHGEPVTSPVAHHNLAPVLTWESACEWVLGFQLNLWHELFHAPFLAQCKRLIAAAFGLIVNDVLSAPLRGCLAAAASAPRHAAPGSLPAGPKWPPESGMGVIAGGAVDGAVGLTRTWSERVVTDQRLGSTIAGKSKSDAGFGENPSREFSEP